MAKVVFMVLGKNIEDFLSNVKEIRLTELRRSGQALYGKCLYKDLDKVKDLAKGHSLEFSILLQTYRPVGYFLVIIFLTSFLLTVFWSSRTWTFVYNSNNDELIEAVHEYLCLKGIKPGTSGDRRYYDEVSKELIKAFPELNFINLTKDGIRLKIDMNVRPVTEEKMPKQKIYAALGGIVRSVHVFMGESLVNPSDVVYKGQLLINGTPYAEGSIIGETVVEIANMTLLKQPILVETGHKENEYHLKIGGLHYSWGFKDDNQTPWSKTVKRYGWEGSRRQFVEVTVIEYNQLKETVVLRTEEEALSLALTAVEEEFVALFGKSNIIEKKIEKTLGTDKVKVTLRAIIETDLTQERLGEGIGRAGS
ncbi:MAG: sporulation protein YqfD [Firmicutes bacterium]|nr:sporulation protein YqfD [Bacillota bacterium]MDD4264193.1 sporulation protein YqfD [Bacillota bacterium]MDD4692946.1 sporulation protein YqfD [Bacillota bacterium]